MIFEESLNSNQECFIQRELLFLAACALLHACYSGLNILRPITTLKNGWKYEFFKRRMATQ